VGGGASSITKVIISSAYRINISICQFSVSLHRSRQNQTNGLFY